MTLKRKIAINVSIAYSILYGISALIIYLSFSSYRKLEFKERLKVKALTTARLLLEVQEIDKGLLKLIDKNSIYKLYNEKTVIYDEKGKLIYNSIQHVKLNWSKKDFDELKKTNYIYKKDNEKDLIGTYFESNNDKYYIVIAAEDRFGYSKLNYLLSILVWTFILGTIIVWIVTYFFIQNLLKPLDKFQELITNITVNQLNTQLVESNIDDEINLLTKAFNKMLLRIEKSFAAQKEFTSNASHELRTPVSRLTLQIENLIKQEGHSESTLAYLKSMSNDINHITDLINSLLLLAKLNMNDVENQFKSERIDEIIFNSYDIVSKNYPDFQLNFDIKSEIDSDFEIQGIESLLEIVFINLFRNAFNYSNDKKINVLLQQTDSKTISVILSNTGNPLTISESQNIFSPFTRGSNAIQTQGSGLGLRISKRILDFHQAKIKYYYEDNLHKFRIDFNTPN